MSNSRASTSTLVTDVRGLLEHVGAELGPTAWRSVTQEEVDRFADLTDDHNPIHVDPQHAAGTPFGTTIAHGFFTLALLTPLTDELLAVREPSLAINYGLDKVRFPSPVPVGAEFRATAVLAEAAEVKGGAIEIKLVVTVEVRDSPKPAVVAECRFRYWA